MTTMTAFLVKFSANGQYKIVVPSISCCYLSWSFFPLRQLPQKSPLIWHFGYILSSVCTRILIHNWWTASRLLLKSFKAHLHASEAQEIWPEDLLLVGIKNGIFKTISIWPSAMRSSSWRETDTRRTRRNSSTKCLIVHFNYRQMHVYT